MLKNDTLKNGTSRIGLYGSAPPGQKTKVKENEIMCQFKIIRCFLNHGV